MPSERKTGQSANFYIEYREGEVQGCAIYRIKQGAVTVWLLLACTQAASAALWRYCFDIDLIRTIKVWSRPIDDPLVWMLHDARALRRRPHDWTWLRLIDVSKALSSRTYAVDGEIVFESATGSARGTRVSTNSRAGRQALFADQRPGRRISRSQSTTWPYPTLGVRLSRPSASPAASRNATPAHTPAPTPCSPPSSDHGRQ